jgi:hypothetical protein
MLRQMISFGLMWLIPYSLCAQEPSGALLHGNGAVSVNGSQLKDSTALMPGDAVQTGETGFGYISAPGSSATIESNTIARFQAGGISLDRGSLSLATSRGMSVFARDFKIAPATGDWTEFYVTRSNGSIQIIARKNSVVVSCGANTATVKQGQQISREDAPDCGILQKGKGAPAAARGPIINSEILEYSTLGAGAALLGWTLAQGDNPVSPARP